MCRVAIGSHNRDSATHGLISSGQDTFSNLTLSETLFSRQIRCRYRLRSTLLVDYRLVPQTRPHATYRSTTRLKRMWRRIMAKTRQRRRAQCRFQVVLEALKAQQTLSQRASEYAVHPTQITHEPKRASLTGVFCLTPRNGAFGLLSSSSSTGTIETDVHAVLVHGCSASSFSRTARMVHKGQTLFCMLPYYASTTLLVAPLAYGEDGGVRATAAQARHRAPE